MHYVDFAKKTQCGINNGFKLPGVPFMRATPDLFLHDLSLFALPAS